MAADVPSVPIVFDRALVRVRRERAARIDPARAHDFLRKAAAAELLDRLLSITRPFERGVELGGAGAFARAWAESAAARDKLGWLASSDLCAALIGGAPAARLVADEERLPFAAAGLDLIVSPLALHWVNDLPGALIQIRQALKPDGVFLGALLGGSTLTELRQSLAAAEVERTGGAGARVSPFADVLDGAQLLQRAGFAMPVADRDAIAAVYADPLKLLAELRALGETAAPAERAPRALSRGVLARAVEIYAERFAAPGGGIHATFEIVYLTGWAPAAGQPQPKRPGSATTRLADALGVAERSAGEKAAPKPGAA